MSEVKRISTECLANIIVPRRWRSAEIVVLYSYIDGSNLNPDDSILAVAACAANRDVWPTWEARWNEILDEFDLAKWHHTEFLSRRKTRKDKSRAVWSEGEWLWARGQICQAIQEADPIYLGATIWRRDYDELKSKFSSLPDDPYFFLLDRIMHRLIQALFEHPKDDGVAIYCDQDKNEKLVRGLGDWHEAYNKANPSFWHPDDAKRAVIRSYGSCIEYVPLQAADIVALEILQAARSGGKQPSWILDKLQKGKFWFVTNLSKDLLEMELNGQAWEPGYKPGYRYL